MQSFHCVVRGSGVAVATVGKRKEGKKIRDNICMRFYTALRIQFGWLDNISPAGGRRYSCLEIINTAYETDKKMCSVKCKVQIQIQRCAVSDNSVPYK